ncbi:MAG: NADH:ubiquinone reductase (non-electrogenic) [Bacillariaceae sp.]|jgi:NADH dehydrogenase
MILPILQIFTLLTTTIFLIDDITLATAFVSRRSSRLSIFRQDVVLSGMYNDQCDVAIMGGGFGGLYTALAISREAKKKGRKVDIALVDNSDRFVFLPLLYDLTVGTASEGEVCPTYDELLEGTGVRFIKASFDSFNGDSCSGSVLKTGGSEQKYVLEEKPKEEDDDNSDTINLYFQASVVSVGATPQSILSLIPGATEYVQPFYTREDAYATRELLFRMDQRIQQGHCPRLAIVGGGYGGVELAACVARRLPKAKVTLISRGRPMAGTRAEPLVDQALNKLGVVCEICSVDEIKKNTNGQITIQRRSNLNGSSLTPIDAEDEWDAVLWTAGSLPAYPVTKNENMDGLALSSSGRLIVDETLRCSFSTEDSKAMPSVWALGDCCEIIPVVQPVPPKTAQAAIQQADVVASNVLAKLFNQESDTKVFKFQDLGSMLSLGGPNGAILGPKEDTQLGSLLVPLIDTARIGFGIADSLFAQIINSSDIDKKVVENLGLSIGGYGLGVDPESTPGTLSGTLSGASRRAIYALRMPTNKQRAVAGASAFISSAAALAKEASDQIQSSNNSEKG